MSQRIEREQLVDLRDNAGAVLLDVLPEEQYRRTHLPGARSVPLAKVKALAESLERETAVITYCNDAT